MQTFRGALRFGLSLIALPLLPRLTSRSRAAHIALRLFQLTNRLFELVRLLPVQSVCADRALLLLLLLPARATGLLTLLTLLTALAAAGGLLAPLLPLLALLPCALLPCWPC